jgi:hypothetical protein
VFDGNSIQQHLRVSISVEQRQRAPLATVRQQQYLPPNNINLSSLSLLAAASAMMLIRSSSNTQLISNPEKILSRQSSTLASSFVQQHPLSLCTAAPFVSVTSPTFSD